MFLFFLTHSAGKQYDSQELYLAGLNQRARIIKRPRRWERVSSVRQIRVRSLRRGIEETKVSSSANATAAVGRSFGLGRVNVCAHETKI